jgi:hypothetical protein
MIVSLHMPKTGGTSLAGVLKGHFGPRLLLDYGDWPINTPRLFRNQKALNDAIGNRNTDFSSYDCIHGHFLPAKYLPLKTAGRVSFVTWLRDPLQRMVSHYDYWLRNYEPAPGATLHRKVVTDGWTLEQFCFSEELRNFYAQFLWSFPVSFFDFIGITEHFAEDLTFFARRYLNITLIGDTPHANAAPAKSATNMLTVDFRRRFEDFHAEDYRIYRDALALRLYS